MNDVSPYAPPAAAELVVPETVPQAVLDAGLGPRSITVLAVLVLLGLVVSVFQIVTEVVMDVAATGPVGLASVIVANLVGSGMYVYVLYRWRRLLNLWVGARKANKYLYAMMGLTVLMLVADLVPYALSTEDAPAAQVIQLAFLVVFGIVSLLYALVLLRCKVELPLFKPYAITTLITGVTLASLVLLLVAIPFMFLAEILFAFLLFGMARRLEDARTPAA
ncbi:MAG TPA: hypothetical protein ENN42_05170 [Thioalkalivibrio sp.]|nr:hypothetical protein [Thioalkalivibrio sp.]